MGRGEEGADLGGLFEDLEQQAAGIHYSERDAELLDRARGEYAAVTFSSRVHASLGRRVALVLADGTHADGTVAQAGVDWCSLRSTGSADAWLVRLDGIGLARGLSPRALPEAARPALARLGFGSALHRLAADAQEVVLHLTAAGRERVRVVRIGADFLEAEPTAGGAGLVVPFSSVLAVRPASPVVA